jgi:DNA repair protein RecO (recombination protein O)
MNASRRVALQPAFLLHHHDYSDSSRILELLTREHGRISLFGHGVRRAKSPYRAVLQPFVPLLLSWSGGTDGGQFTGAEFASEVRPLPAARLMSGFYLNELLLRLTPRGEAIPEIFDLYALTLARLGDAVPEQAALRNFERQLLEQLGYGLDLGRESGSGEPLSAGRYYHFQPGVGLRASRDEGAAHDVYLGSQLLDIAGGRFDSPESLRAAKRLLRAAIEHCLEGRDLRSRDVMLALRRLETDK